MPSQLFSLSSASFCGCASHLNSSRGGIPVDESFRRPLKEVTAHYLATSPRGRRKDFDPMSRWFTASVSTCRAKYVSPNATLSNKHIFQCSAFHALRRGGSRYANPGKHSAIMAAISCFVGFTCWRKSRMICALLTSTEGIETDFAFRRMRRMARRTIDLSRMLPSAIVRSTITEGSNVSRRDWMSAARFRITPQSNRRPGPSKTAYPTRRDLMSSDKTRACPSGS